MSTGSRDGFVHLYYGPGKGKTTAAMGLVVRAVGHGLTASVLQFMKGAEEMYDQYGEIKQFRDIPEIETEQFPAGHARSRDDLTETELQTLEDALGTAESVVSEGATDVVVLDEILTLYDLEVVDGDGIVDILRARDESVELLLTGREAPTAVVDGADYVTYMGDIKHPFRMGVGPRVGIEY